LNKDGENNKTEFEAVFCSSRPINRMLCFEFSPQLVIDFYYKKLHGIKQKSAGNNKIYYFEASNILENHLWPKFLGDKCTPEHVLSILIIENEKFRQHISISQRSQIQRESFESFFSRIITLKEERKLGLIEVTSYILFLANCFRSLEDKTVRVQVLKLISLPMWCNLSTRKLRLELHRFKLMKHFKHLTNKETVLSFFKVSHVPINFRSEAKFISSLIDDFLFKLSNFELRGNEYDENLMSIFFETFIEFLIDLLVQLPTRRFISNILEDQAVLIRCKMSELYLGVHTSNLFGRLVELLQFYLKFELNNHTGESYHDEDIFRLQCSKNQMFQRISFKLGTNLRELSLLKCADVSNRELLSKYVNKLSLEEIRDLVCRQLLLVSKTLLSIILIFFVRF
jgi:intron-binding protein aquarius